MRSTARRPTRNSKPLRVTVAVAGRMVLKRVMGKACFATLQDMSGRIQLYVTLDALGRRRSSTISSTGTWATSSAPTGTLFKTKTGELSVKVTRSACSPRRCGRCRKNSTA